MLGRRKGECENKFGAGRSQARVKPGRRNISAVTDQFERVEKSGRTRLRACGPSSVAPEGSAGGDA